MADVFELTLALDLHDPLSEEELAELHWHLGLGPKPEILRIVTAFPVAMEDEHGNVVVEDHPEPLLGCHGEEAFKTGGALVSALVRRQDSRSGAWALTSRQEIHPDDFERTGELLSWLATKAVDAHRCSDDGDVHLGWIRFCEEVQPKPLVVVGNGAVVWPNSF